jgi:hypothetical protein
MLDAAIAAAEDGGRPVTLPALSTPPSKELAMSENSRPSCPQCAESLDATPGLPRRRFLRVLGGSTAALALGAPRLLADVKTLQEKPTPAESLAKELFAMLTAEQKQEVVLPWDHGAGPGRLPTRMRMYNAPIGKKTIGDSYTKAQQELIERTLKALSSGEEGYECISRKGTFDSSGSLQGCGLMLFGEPGEGKKWAWVFTGHHLTVRCDGDSEEGAAFGGPIYYGHSPNGYSRSNVFNFQTRSVLSVYDALSEKQRKVAVISGSPGEQEPSIKLRPKDQPKPGLSYGEMNKDQQELVEKVMRDILLPYRKEDVNEVMAIIKATGGMEKIHLAFYQDPKMTDEDRWHFWRLEGPGFVWNYRVLPHVHTYVNISSRV